MNMSYMFEVYYKAPPNARREAALTDRVLSLGGCLSYREETDETGAANVCLTYEFDSLEQAEMAATFLREQGEYVEGPVEYGPVMAPDIRYDGKVKNSLPTL
jgi:hypothetical protein